MGQLTTQSHLGTGDVSLKTALMDMIQPFQTFDNQLSTIEHCSVTHFLSPYDIVRIASGSLVSALDDVNKYANLCQAQRAC